MPTPIRSRSRLTLRTWAVLLPIAMLLACGSDDDPTSPGGDKEEETPPGLTYQFGAKFEPPVGRVVHGIGQWRVYNEKDLGNAAQAEAAWAEWFQPYFELIANRPEIKWFHYVSDDGTQASFYSVQGWKNNDLSVSPTLAARYVAEISKAKYLHANEKHLLKDYGKY